MKTFLVIAAVFGFSTSAALAECADSHVTASAKVDKELTTASIVTKDVRADEAAVLKQQPAEGQTSVTK